MKKKAVTSEEKFRVLDARDKLIRLTTVETTDISKAVSKKGVCPDMCPEKERLMREAKNQVSSFELIENSRYVMNHDIAIKQYSRSSAAQEEPLPHELRPEPILKMSMLYLLHRIVGICDKPEANVSDWFHFLWDRMRSIRKDITQQELCSQEAVLLVEQCARFHIHCAARLVAEDPSVFDQKINTENLTKCLQSLKYMYHDLTLKRIRCTNEAEFRGYVILLNLNDTNFLWELKQLPQDIQQSKEIQFAIQVYLAIENNNYIKFFQLVRTTTYLNACIMFRYFYQVRRKAIDILMKAYVPPRSIVILPVPPITYNLGFEDTESCCDFLQSHGLNVTMINDQYTVRLDRNNFYWADPPMFTDRAVNIVESKLKTSVGECVYGGPLDSADIFEKHQIHDSFDENGYLLDESWLAEDQNYLKPPSPKKKIPHTPFRNEPGKSEPIFKVPSPAGSPRVSKANIHDQPKALTPTQEIPSEYNLPLPLKKVDPRQGGFSFGKSTYFGPSTIGNQSQVHKDNIFSKPVVLQTAVTSNPFSNNTFGSTGRFADNQNTILSSITQSQTTHNMLKQAFANESSIEESQKELQQKLDAERRRLHELEEKEQKRIDEAKRVQLAKEKQILEEKKHKAEILRQAKQQRVAERKAKIELDSTNLNDDLFKDIILSFLRQFATEELINYKELENRIKETTNSIITEFLYETLLEYGTEEIETNNQQLEHNYILQAKYFIRWIRYVNRQRRQRKVIECISLGLPSKGEPSELIEAIHHPLQSTTLRYMNRYMSGKPTEITLNETAETPIDLINSVGLTLAKVRRKFSVNGFKKNHLYWKLLISIPTDTEELRGVSTHLMNWLRAVFNKSTKQSNIFYINSGVPDGCVENVAICIRVTKGISLLNESGVQEPENRNCNNSDAILFYTTPYDFKTAKERLHKVFKSVNPLKTIPLAIIVYNSKKVTETDVYLGLDIETLYSTGQISDVLIEFNVNHQLNSKKKSLKECTINCQEFCAQEYLNESPLEMQATPYYLKQCLGDDFFARLYYSAQHNYELCKAMTSYPFMIKLFNKEVENMLTIITEDFSSYPEFPKEFQSLVPPVNFTVPQDLEHFPVDWKMKCRNSSLKEFLRELILPMEENICNSRCLQDFEMNVLAYCKSIFQEDKYITMTTHQIIQSFLKDNIEVNLETIEDEFTRCLENYNWLDVFRIIAVQKLTYHYEMNQMSLTTEVIYKKKSFTDLIHRPWWFGSDLLSSSVSYDNTDTDVVDGPLPEKRSKLATEDVDALLIRSQTCLTNADNRLNMFRKTMNTCWELSKDFDNELYNSEKQFRQARDNFKESIKVSKKQ